MQVQILKNQKMFTSYSRKAKRKYNHGNAIKTRQIMKIAQKPHLERVFGTAATETYTKKRTIFSESENILCKLHNNC
jgi:hypothetical protein